ncbi:MAG: ROK family transcriptional regulator [Deltaproteobacteria bacterium]|nr:ROK family transcriptional regulator [Deltaproteobacteria bacterium]
MLEKQSQFNVKLNNLQLILKTIINHETLSRADLVRLTHISKPTVSNLIEDLLGQDLVLEIGQGHSRTGRKPILIKFNSTLKYFLVFTIGREDFHVAVSDLKGNIQESYTGAFKHLQNHHDRLLLLYAHMQELLEKIKITSKDLLKIHGAAPGVYVEPGKALKWSDHGFPEEQNMQAFLEQAFNTPVLLNHSSKISLFGEKIAGRARDISHAVYIDFGYGLGSAFMFNDQIYFGANKSAGEIGYVYSELKEFNSYCLKPYGWGALETIISGKALQKKGIEVAEKQKDTLILKLANKDKKRITAKTVFDAAEKGDPHAYYILKEAFKYFNMWLCNIINMLNPQRIIIGGGISNAGDFLLSFVENEIKDKVLIMPELAISDLKDKAAVIGAIAYLIEHTDFFTEL